MLRMIGCMVLLLVTATAPAVAQGAKNASAPDVRSQLIGAWRLVWDEDVDANGKMVRLNETGIIMYTSDGHMAVQIRTHGGSPRQAVVQYDKGGYEGYYGTFTVNEKDHSVTHHVEGALVESLLGKDLTRVYEFSGKQLILHSSRADEHWRICWEKY